MSATAKSLQSCPTLCDPTDSSPPEHWSGLPFPSPMQESEKWNWSRSVTSDPQRPHGLQPSRLFRPWDFPGKNTGVGCHFPLQCRKVKSEIEVTQSYCWWIWLLPWNHELIKARGHTLGGSFKNVLQITSAYYSIKSCFKKIIMAIIYYSSDTVLNFIFYILWSI